MSAAIDNLIYKTATGDGLPRRLAVLVVAQARLETANYTHKFAAKGNNYFGYSYVKGAKWQIAPGGLADNKQKIAQYASVEDSVHELTDWIRRRQKDGQFPKDLNVIQTPLQYASYLRNGAHPYGGLSTKQYADGITSRLKKVNIGEAVAAIGSSASDNKPNLLPVITIFLIVGFVLAAGLIKL